MNDDVHGGRGAGGLQGLGWTIRQAARALWRTPTFTWTCVLILTLGISMATTVFTIVRAVALRELPVREPTRIISLRSFRDPTVSLALTKQQVDGLRRESRTMQDVAGTVHWGAQTIPSMEGNLAIALDQAMVTANFFDVLGVHPVLGRLLDADDGREGAAHVAVISYHTWRRQFDGDPRVLNRRLTTPQDLVSYAIVGVAPPGLDYPVGTDYWILMRPFDFVNVIARLAPGATPSAARSEFAGLVQRLDHQRSDPRYPTGASIQTLTQAVLGEATPLLVALTAAVALLLLIACMNVGTLVLLRATRRAPEMVIRRALGASAGQVVRMQLAESALLGLAGGACGLACAVGLLQVLLALAPERIPRADMILLAGAPVTLAGGVSFVAVLLFGVLPAFAAARGNLAFALRGDTRTGRESRRRRRLRQSVVAGQVALAVIMLAGAGLLVRTLQRFARLDLGFAVDHLSIVVLTIPFPKFNNSVPRLFTMFDQLYGRLREVPGVTALTPVLYRPFVGANLMQVTPLVEGQSKAVADAHAPLPLEAGGREYFQTFRIPIERGRGFLDTDRESSPNVVVVSESVASRLWPGQDPIGKRLRFASDSAEWRTVVGVAGESRFRRLREATPMMYVPWRQLATFGVFAMRTRGDLASVLPAVRSAIRSFDPQLEVWDARSMDDYLAGPLAQPRFGAMLLSGFGLVALLLSAIGLYGVMASTVRERTRELGVRMALGATPERLRRTVLRDALVLSSVGAFAGLVGAGLGARLLSALLFEVSPTDPLTLAGVSALLVVTALAASYLPAYRATRIDPVRALRAE